MNKRPIAILAALLLIVTGTLLLWPGEASQARAGERGTRILVDRDGHSRIATRAFDDEDWEEFAEEMEELGEELGEWGEELGEELGAMMEELAEEGLFDGDFLFRFDGDRGGRHRVFHDDDFDLDLDMEEFGVEMDRLGEELARMAEQIGRDVRRELRDIDLDDDHRSYRREIRDGRDELRRELRRLKRELRRMERELD